MDWNEFCTRVSKILRPLVGKINLEYNDENLSFSLSSDKYIYLKDDYIKLYDKVSQYNFSPFSITSDKTFEILIDLPDMDSRRDFSFHFEEKLHDFEINDTENKIKYSFKEISDIMIWFIIKSYDQRVFFNRLPFYIFERKWELVENKDIFNIIRLALRLPFCVVIESDTVLTYDKFSKYAHAYLFNFAYNLNLVFKTLSEIDEVFPIRESRNKRRTQDIDEIMAPHLNYKQELLEHYNMALISSDPFVQFIGFYHIMEYFFEEIYNEDILATVQKIIQHPGFSSRRNKDIVNLIENIKRKTRQGKENFQGNELEALELTIKKYINISDLYSDLQEYNPESLNYYANHEISFSKGDTIDLKEFTNDKLPKKLAARIYKTRNSLVHSKSNNMSSKDRGIYRPFINSNELSKEIPLMRMLAEYIIINSASFI